MGTSKSATVAARQRVEAHLRDQIAALTDATAAGHRARDELARVRAERAAANAEFDRQEAAADDQFAAAVDTLRAHRQSTEAICTLLEVSASTLRPRRTAARTPAATVSTIPSDRTAAP